MTTSTQDSCIKKIISGRDHDHGDDASVRPPDMHENEERPTGSSPTIISYNGVISLNSCSPNNVVNDEGKSLPITRVGPSRSARKGGSTRRCKDTSSTTDVPESTLDTRSEQNNDLSAISISRVRTRAAARPARFRQPAAPGSSIAAPANESSENNETFIKYGKKCTLPVEEVMLTPKSSDAKRGGAWTDKEQEQFEAGCVSFGWGNWQHVEKCVPTRNRKQVKSHAQKFQKHHPDEKIRMVKEHEKLKKMAPTMNDSKLEVKKKCTTSVVERPFETKPKPKKRPKPTKSLTASRKSGKASTRGTKAPPLEFATVKAHETKSDKKPADFPKKRLQAIALRALPTKKAKYGVAVQNGTGLGTWTFEEQEQFKDGCIIYGWGNWRGVESEVPSRTNAQIKSHAQKFQKHHPDLKKQIEMEHEWRSKFKANAQNEKNVAAELPPSSKNNTSIKNNRALTQEHVLIPRGSWSFTEHKQFEDGCILHGWGNWTKVVSHIPTRDISQVRSHAQMYQKHSADKRGILEREHERHYRRADETDTKNTSLETDYTELNHILLGMGGARGKKDNVHLVSRDTDESTGRVSLPTQGSKDTTAGDDVGVAEAILALNSARWHVGKNERETQLPRSGDDTGLEEPSIAISLNTNGIVGKNKDSGDVSLDSQKTEDKTFARCEIDSNETLSMGSSKTDEVASKIGVDVDVRAEMNGVDDGSSEFDQPVAPEPNDGDELAAGLAARNIEDSPMHRYGPTGQVSANSSTKPPNHWLAANSWGECLSKIQLWDNKLSKEEQNMEWLRYDRLPDTEKERLEQKLMNLLNLMYNRSTT